MMRTLRLPLVGLLVAFFPQGAIAASGSAVGSDGPPSLGFVLAERSPVRAMAADSPADAAGIVVASSSQDTCMPVEQTLTLSDGSIRSEIITACQGPDGWTIVDPADEPTNAEDKAKSVERAGRTQGVVRLKAQHAGELLYSGKDFTIHERINYVPKVVGQEGPERCELNRIGTADEYATSYLVAVVDRDSDFNLTRRWIWDHVRPIVQDVVLPRVCPQAYNVGVNFYIKGLDVTLEGDIYNTDEVEFPYVKIPPEPVQSYDRHYDYRAVVRQFMSPGILKVTFRGPARKDEPCTERSWNCRFEQMEPKYFGSDAKEYYENLRFSVGSTWARPHQQKAMLEKIDKALENLPESLDRQANFNKFAEQTRRRYLAKEQRKRQKAELLRLLAPMIEALQATNEVVKREGLAKTLLMGLANRSGGGQRCAGGDMYGCVEDVPVILLP